MKSIKRQLQTTRRYIRKLRESKEIDESLVDILESVYDKKIFTMTIYKNGILERPPKEIKTIKVTKQEHKKLHNLLIDCSKNRDIALLVKGCADYKNIARHKKWYKNQKIENTN